MPDTIQNYETIGACQVGDAQVTVTLSDFYFTAQNVAGNESLVQPFQVLVTPTFVDLGANQMVNLTFTTTNGGIFQAAGNDENKYTFNYTVDPPPPMILGQGLTDLPTDPGIVLLTAQLCLGASNGPGAYVTGTFNCPTENTRTLMTSSVSPPAMVTFPPVSTLGVFITADLQGQGGYAYLFGIGSNSTVQPASGGGLGSVPEPAYMGVAGLAGLFLVGAGAKLRQVFLKFRS